MEKQLLQNAYSILTKEEDVKTLDHHIIPGTFVVEITHPFPGYYFSSDFITSNSKPQSILMVLKGAISIEFFYRKIAKIKKYSEFSFKADMAELQIYNQKFFTIRVMGLDAYEQIAELQRYFKDEGFLLKKQQNVAAKALIKISKFSDYELISGVYHSVDNSHFNYFPVDKDITWKMFEHITLKIRHNFNHKKFDAALGVLFYQGKVVDVIRIYTKELNDSEILKLQTMYKAELLNF
jgi:hypothetical protein